MQQYWSHINPATLPILIDMWKQQQAHIAKTLKKTIGVPPSTTIGPATRKLLSDLRLAPMDGRCRHLFAIGNWLVIAIPILGRLNL